MEYPIVENILVNQLLKILEQENMNRFGLCWVDIFWIGSRVEFLATIRRGTFEINLDFERWIWKIIKIIKMILDQNSKWTESTILKYAVPKECILTRFSCDLWRIIVKLWRYISTSTRQKEQMFGFPRSPSSFGFEHWENVVFEPKIRRTNKLCILKNTTLNSFECLQYF